MLLQFARNSNAVAVVPLIGLTVSPNLPAFIPLLPVSAHLWMTKERQVCSVVNVWRPPALGLMLGVIGLRIGVTVCQWYCDECGRGFDRSQLLLPIILMQTSWDTD
jgi:hypothetical protein